MESIISPHDLLPITRPLEDTNLPDETFFYENVVKHLIPDIIKMTANGIPIDLNRVKELETTVDNVLNNVHTNLANNKMMLDFLNYTNNKLKEDKTKELENKTKSIEHFIKPFDIKNTIHRTFVVNAFLKSINKEDMEMEKWSIKDLKKLNQILASKFITDLINNNIQEYMSKIIDDGMLSLATIKMNTYNKNKVTSKIDALQDQNLIKSFNPGSPIQLQRFFEFYNIESESTTATGNPQWDRAELEKLQKLINVLIDNKGYKND